MRLLGETLKAPSPFLGEQLVLRPVIIVTLDILRKWSEVVRVHWSIEDESAMHVSRHGNFKRSRTSNYRRCRCRYLCHCYYF